VWSIDLLHHQRLALSAIVTECLIRVEVTLMRLFSNVELLDLAASRRAASDSHIDAV
jgi:hypothetical protein